MKTAVSIPDDVFHSVERLARHLDRPRSQLYTQALIILLEKNQAASIQESLDKIYAEQPSKLDASVLDLQTRSISREKW